MSKTLIEIREGRFVVNGAPTYEGVKWRGVDIEGMLMNSRMVQGIFDDMNPETRERWAYPDTGVWDPDRNTREFIEAMPLWRAHGVIAFTLNCQGGNPQGYSKHQPWHNSLFLSDGSMDPSYLGRLQLILDAADRLGMVVILGYFYFGQDQRLVDEAAVIRATDNMTKWLHERRYRNILIEVCNESTASGYHHPILRTDRVAELIERIRSVSGNGHHFLTSVSMTPGGVPTESIAEAADFHLLHGNKAKNPMDIRDRLILPTRALKSYGGEPIVINEDDHFNFDRYPNNMVIAIENGASWGYLETGASDYVAGYQSPPVNWGLNTERKRAFFELARQVTTGALTEFEEVDEE